MGREDGLYHAAAPQLVEVGECVFCAWQDDDVSIGYVARSLGVEEMHTLVALKGGKVSIVADMRQEHHCHIHLSVSDRAALASQSHAVLFIDGDVAKGRDDTEHRDATDVFHHLSSRLKEPHVATKLIDDDALDACSVLWCLKHHTAIAGGKDTSTVDVGDKDDSCVGIARHGHVDEIRITEVYLADTACSLHDDGLVA